VCLFFDDQVDDLAGRDVALVDHLHAAPPAQQIRVGQCSRQYRDGLWGAEAAELQLDALGRPQPIAQLADDHVSVVIVDPDRRVAHDRQVRGQALPVLP